MPLPQRLPGSELRRHIPPRRTRTEPPCNRFQHLAVITPPPPPAALIRGQHRLDQLPQLVGDHTSSDHSPIIGVVDRNLWETRPSPAMGRLRHHRRIDCPTSVLWTSSPIRLPPRLWHV